MTELPTDDQIVQRAKSEADVHEDARSLYDALIEQRTDDLKLHRNSMEFLFHKPSCEMHRTNPMKINECTCGLDAHMHSIKTNLGIS